MFPQEELDRAFDSRFPQDIRHKLRNSRVAIAGLGGLGSNIAVMLARSGIGHMLLVDFDAVDTTNLNRQAYAIPHIGMKKTDAIRSVLADINPYLDVETQCIKVTPKNAAQLFHSYPILCEAFDLPDQKAMLISSILGQCPNTVVISGNGMAGYGPSNDIQTSHPLRNLYVCGDSTTEAAAGMGLMAPRVAICAGHQANQVIQLILNQ